MVDETAEIVRGQGVERNPHELLEDQGHLRADARLIRRALREGWQIPATIRETLPQKLADLIEQAEDARGAAACARVLAELDRLDLDAMRAAVEIEHLRGERGRSVPMPAVAVQVNVGESATPSRFREMIAAIGGLVPREETEETEEAALDVQQSNKDPEGTRV